MHAHVSTLLSPTSRLVLVGATALSIGSSCHFSLWFLRTYPWSARKTYSHIFKPTSLEAVILRPGQSDLLHWGFQLRLMSLAQNEDFICCWFGKQWLFFFFWKLNRLGEILWDKKMIHSFFHKMWQHKQKKLLCFHLHGKPLIQPQLKHFLQTGQIFFFLCHLCKHLHTITASTSTFAESEGLKYFCYQSEKNRVFLCHSIKNKINLNHLRLFLQNMSRFLSHGRRKLGIKHFSQNNSWTGAELEP